MFDYGKEISTKKTPQSQKVPGKKRQKRNSAGGISFKITKEQQLDRFLILGSESPTYYASSSKLTVDNAKRIRKLIDEDGQSVVARAVEISESYRAPKNDPAIFVLAMCAKLGDVDTRRAAYEAVPRVCRTGTHLFQFVQACEHMGGWGRGMRRAIGEWYNEKDSQNLQYQVMKYKQRSGWSHRDLLRLSHPTPRTKQHDGIFEYVTKGTGDMVFKSEAKSALWFIWACEELKRCDKVEQVVDLIDEYNLPREVVPTQWLSSVKVWEAMLPRMPMTAMIRNLAKMTSIGMLDNMGENGSLVLKKLEGVREGWVHPITVLNALMTYSAGRGLKGSLTWTPVRRIIDGLDAAFYTAFGNVTPTGLRTVLALDVSGSMSGPQITGLSLSPREASAAMALVTASVEPSYEIVGFTGGGFTGRRQMFTELQISPRQRITDAIRAVSRLPFGPTNCAAPILAADQTNTAVDHFVIYTDNETWNGSIHPYQALRAYRQKFGIDAKLTVVAMTSNGFTIADPEDSGMLDVVGFDSATPELISQFAVG